MDDKVINQMCEWFFKLPNNQKEAVIYRAFESLYDSEIVGFDAEDDRGVYYMSCGDSLKDEE